MNLISPNFSDMLKPNIKIKKFPDGDSYVRIPELKQCEGKEVVFYHRLYPDQDASIVQTLLVLEALRTVDAKVTLVAPYLPYSRQDKIVLEGEVKSSSLVCSLLARAGVRKLVTIDCHFLKKEGEFDFAGLRIMNVSMNREVLEHARKKLNNEEFEVISPDIGASYLVQEVGGKTMRKVRGRYQKGKAAYRTVEKVEGEFDFKGKNVVIIDDMISTGSTMIKAIENVKSSGAKKIACTAIHGFFLKDSLARIRQICEITFTTNSIPCAVAEVNVLDKLNEALEEKQSKLTD